MSALAFQGVVNNLSALKGVGRYILSWDRSLPTLLLGPAAFALQVDRRIMLYRAPKRAAVASPAGSLPMRLDPMIGVGS